MSVYTAGADRAPCEWLSVGGRVRLVPGCVVSGGQLGTGPRPWGGDWATGGERRGSGCLLSKRLYFSLEERV